jgi:hypothetical protein
VVHARTAVGGRRALVEGPHRRTGALLDAPSEDLAILPAREDLVLERGRLDIVIANARARL